MASTDDNVESILCVLYFRFRCKACHQLLWWIFFPTICWYVDSVFTTVLQCFCCEALRGQCGKGLFFLVSNSNYYANWFLNVALIQMSTTSSLCSWFSLQYDSFQFIFLLCVCPQTSGSLCAAYLFIFCAFIFFEADLFGC